jgi:hypothetical protein
LLIVSPVLRLFTSTFRNFLSPAKVFIEPAGSSTSPSGPRQTTLMPASYDGRVAQISNGSSPARRPTGIGTSVRRSGLP